MSVHTRVAFASWDPPRHHSLQTLLRDVVHGVTVHPSETREHASVWAKRLWVAAAEDEHATHTAFLNDDVRTCPRWSDALEALTWAVPDEVISLATITAHSRSPWTRSYWLTGPGYLLPRARLPDLLAFAEEWKDFFSRVNEDQLIMQWCWARQCPVWHCVPALVKHDASVPSTLGYDGHPNRVTRVAWDTMPDVDIASVEYWRQGIEAPALVECPWMSMGRLQQIQSRRGKVVVCAACNGENPAIEFNNGNGICRPCLWQAARAAIMGQ